MAEASSATTNRLDIATLVLGFWLGSAATIVCAPVSSDTPSATASSVSKGSLVIGDFDPNISDIDLVAALSTEVDDREFDEHIQIGFMPIVHLERCNP